MILDIERTRRNFLRMAFAGVGSLTVGACGGGTEGQGIDSPTGGAGTPAPAPGATPAPSPSPTPTPTPSPAPSPSPSPTPAPAPAPAPTPAPAPEPFTWQIAPDQTLALAAGTTTTIATGAFGMTASVSPALPAGRTLTVTSRGHVVIAAAANAPVVDLHGPWLIEVSG